MNPSTDSPITGLRRAGLVRANLVRPTLKTTPHPEDPHFPPHVEHETHHDESNHPMSGEDLAQHGYTSSIPWVSANADCLVVSCSDHRFEDQTRDFLIYGLGFQNPHVLQWPSGVTIASGLAVLTGSLPKAFDLLFQKALKLTHATNLILVAHEDCGAYKGDDLVNKVARRFTGKSVREIQVTHLQDAVRSLRPILRGVTVRGFYADVIQGNEGEHVNFKEVSVVHS